ncbi:C2 calcium-dependent domain-containing protein 4C [Liparis tanakae]|uniref:C2 calcium-dependent domain-containing protein 4C n=1 Tax=Liparis tanakae TaxID=230148 RepID=A0A4Z2H255_9TELE|nr:C2 calcium-dependent domain-containing protein 4C [Liparis tanakae]
MQRDDTNRVRSEQLRSGRATTDKPLAAWQRISRLRPGEPETSVTCGESWTSRGGRANRLIPNRVEGSSAHRPSLSERCGFRRRTAARRVQMGLCNLYALVPSIKPALRRLRPSEDAEQRRAAHRLTRGEDTCYRRSEWTKTAESPGDTKNLLRAANRHIIQIESADDVGDTNADPQSQTAMSLPYVPKTQTPYGFATLKESPHTRRKESLFHCELTSPITSPNTQRKTPGRSGEAGNHLNPADFNTSHMNPYRYFSGGESDTCSSAESSPFSSPLLSRSASLLKIFTHETQAKVVKAKRSFARHSSLSTDECSSAEPSPNVQRRLHVPSLHGAGPSDHGLHREHTVNLHKGGTVRISGNYDSGTSRLLIRVLVAESLYDKHFDIKSINCCVSVYLNPGKLQKQRSNIIKNSRNPVFNEDFFFDSISSVQVKNLLVKFKVVNKGTSLKRDTLLGERELPLAKLLSGV